MKKRNEKALEYENNYSEIPINYYDRLLWLCDKLNINKNKYESILEKRNEMMHSLSYNELLIVLYEEPEGSPRPRFRIINRSNLINSALKNSNFVHVYSLTGKEDNCYMKRLLEGELYSIEKLLNTPCIVEYTTFFKTPNSFNNADSILSEIGLIRPISKPDWDNLGKKYSDMFNNNVWLDDALVIEGVVRKYYSVLPRVEIKLKYLNMLYNKYQYNSIYARTQDDTLTYFGGK